MGAGLYLGYTTSDPAICLRSEESSRGWPRSLGACTYMGDLGEVLTPGFGLTQLWPVWPFETADGRPSLSVPSSLYKSVFETKIKSFKNSQSNSDKNCTWVLHIWKLDTSWLCILDMTAPWTVYMITLNLQPFCLCGNLFSAGSYCLIPYGILFITQVHVTLVLPFPPIKPPWPRQMSSFKAQESLTL